MLIFRSQWPKTSCSVLIYGCFVAPWSVDLPNWDLPIRKMRSLKPGSFSRLLPLSLINGNKSNRIFSNRLEFVKKTVRFPPTRNWTTSRKRKFQRVGKISDLMTIAKGGKNLILLHGPKNTSNWSILSNAQERQSRINLAFRIFPN